ncbi:hypothetical protein EBZ80_08615 [bacterium]|nr:hypothetical protein [bacterium]
MKTKKHRGGLYFDEPEVAGMNESAETMDGSMNFPYSIGFRLTRDSGEVESWGSAHCVQHPLLSWDVTTPKDDYDHYVGFRLVWHSTTNNSDQRESR